MNGRFKECEIEYHTETRKLPKSRGWRCWCCLAGSSLSLSPLLSSGLDYKYVMSVKTRVCLTEPIWTTETFLKHECDVGMGSGFSSLQDQLLISYPALNAGDKNALIFSPKIKNKKIPKKFDKKGPILSFRNESNFTNLSLVKIFIEKKQKKQNHLNSTFNDIFRQFPEQFLFLFFYPQSSPFASQQFKVTGKDGRKDSCRPKCICLHLATAV